MSNKRGAVSCPQAPIATMPASLALPPWALVFRVSEATPWQTMKSPQHFSVRSNTHPCVYYPQNVGIRDLVLKTWPSLPLSKLDFSSLSTSTFLIWQELLHTSCPLLLTTSSWPTLNVEKFEWKKPDEQKEDVHILRDASTVPLNKELFNTAILIIIIVMNYQATCSGVKKRLFPFHVHLLIFISISSPDSSWWQKATS